MGRKHDGLYADAKAAIDRLFGDTSVPPSQTRESLEALKEEISSLIENVPDDADKD